MLQFWGVADRDGWLGWMLPQLLAWTFREMLWNSTLHVNWTILMMRKWQNSVSGAVTQSFLLNLHLSRIYPWFKESVLCGDLSERLFLLIICSSSFRVSSAVCADAEWMNQLCDCSLPQWIFAFFKERFCGSCFSFCPAFSVFKYRWNYDEQNSNKTFQKIESIRQKRHWNKTNPTTTFL